jgi:hypothetical protein
MYQNPDRIWVNSREYPDAQDGLPSIISWIIEDRKAVKAVGYWGIMDINRSCFNSVQKYAQIRKTGFADVATWFVVVAIFSLTLINLISRQINLLRRMGVVAL